MVPYLKKLQNLILWATALLTYYTLSDIAFHQFCPVVLFTGYPCPGCGLTRAALLLMEGRLLDSLAVHPFLIPILLLLAAFLYCYFFNEKGLHILVFVSVGLAVLMFLFYWYRMLTVFPGDLPMTYYYDNLFGWSPPK